MRRWTLIAVIVAAFGLGGCAARGGVRGGGVGIYATVPPPPLRVESYGRAPGPGYGYIQGYWGWQGGNHAWVPGRWERIPPGRRRWEPGRWTRNGNRYYWRDGRWR